MEIEKAKHINEILSVITCLNKIKNLSKEDTVIKFYDYSTFLEFERFSIPKKYNVRFMSLVYDIITELEDELEKL